VVKTIAEKLPLKRAPRKKRGLDVVLAHRVRHGLGVWVRGPAPPQGSDARLRRTALGTGSAHGIDG